jgi:hypothetical protein
MRIWPLTKFRVRWKAARDARVLAAAEVAQARERATARRRLLDNARVLDLASHQDDNRSTRNGPTRMPNTGPFPSYGERRGCRRQHWSGGRR